MEPVLAESESGERESIKEIGAVFLAQRHRLMAFTQGLVRNPCVAEDIFQEVWIRFAEASAKGIVIENKSAWCRAVARNLIFHHWRERKSEYSVGDPELFSLVETAFEESEAEADNAELRRQSLAQCLQQLPEKSRELLRLKYYAGVSAKGIGEALQKSPESVLMALSRVRRLMAACIENRLKGARS